MLKSRQSLTSFCSVCGYSVPSDKLMEHNRSKPHFLNLVKHYLSSKEDELVKEKEGLKTFCEETEESGTLVTARCTPDEFISITLQIHSNRYDMRLIRAEFLEETEQVQLMTTLERRGTLIPKKTYTTLRFKMKASQQTSKIYPLALKFSREGNDDIVLVRYLRLSCMDQAIASLEPDSQYMAVEPLPQLSKARKIVRVKVNKTCAGMQDEATRAAPRRPTGHCEEVDDIEDVLPRTEAVTVVKLNFYMPSPMLRQLHIEGLEEKEDMQDDLKEYLALITDYLKKGVSSEEPENYDKYFQVLISCEDIQQEADIRLYDKLAAELHPFEDDIERFEIEIEGLEEGRPSLLPYDKIYVRQQDGDIEYEGFIHRVKSQSVEIIMGVEFYTLYDGLTGRNIINRDFSDPSSDTDDRQHTNVRFGVRFSINRKVMRMMHRALQQYEELLTKKVPIHKVLIPEVAWPSMPTLTRLPALDLVNKHIADNPEQHCAIRNIVLGTHRPAPYILFGPPGTGKTTTISEAIIQVYRVLPTSNILIVTPSNSAANVVAEKILRSCAIPRSDIFRLYGVTSHELKSTPDLLKISNWSATEKKFLECTERQIRQYRVVACTLSMSGSLVTLGIKRGHFTHIFIDEAGHAMEPEAIIPIVGLLEIHNPDEENKVGGSVILSGDHLQLGPVIRSPIARSFTLVKSLLERLMLSIPYSRMKNRSFNPLMLTKLVRNFRSHPDILTVPNKLFYDGELEAYGPQDITHSLVMYEKLPGNGTPLIFHGVHGRELRESSNPSFFNPEEIAVVLEYIKHLLDPRTLNFDNKPIMQSDIGIIAPYRKQVLKMRQILKMYNFDGVTVGSTEEFQGQERLIMFITTVRCSCKAFDARPGQSLGFLRNRKRFNVATTRAKALMIIVGDPRVLRHDYCWRKLMEFCRDNDAWAGEKLISDHKQFDDLFKTLERLEMSLGLSDLQGVKLAANGQITITDVTLQEEPRWREDE